jgi:hypothetical protein
MLGFGVLSDADVPERAGFEGTSTLNKTFGHSRAFRRLHNAMPSNLLFSG